MTQEEESMVSEMSPGEANGSLQRPNTLAGNGRAVLTCVAEIYIDHA